MSSGSFKELTKAITASIPTSHLPLPDGLIQIVQAYLDKHHPIEESDSQRLHDELLSIYQKDVKSDPSRYAIFVAILRQLRPALAGSSARFLRWWDPLVVPVLEHMAEEKQCLMEEAHGFLLEILAYDPDDGHREAADTSTAIASKLVQLWLDKSSTAGDIAAGFIAKQVKSVLIDYGKKCPKAFLTTQDKFFVKKTYRSQVLILLCDFVQYNPPHLHQVLETPLFDNILQCLQHDTATAVVSMALTALTMFLPHFPKATGTKLPVLFNIYRRLLFWDRERLPSHGSVPSSTDPEKASIEERCEHCDPEIPGWEKATPTSDSQDDTVPSLGHYFTFLYGLYPLNLMSYIRKPERYLRHANYQDDDDVDIQATEIRQRSEIFRHVHLLHPNFFSTTIEGELSDPNRWMNSDAGDVATTCIALYRPLEDTINSSLETLQSLRPTEMATTGPSLDLEPVDRPLLDPNADVPEERDRSRVPSGLSGSWRNTTSTAADSFPLEDSPTLGPINVNMNVRASLPGGLLLPLTPQQEPSNPFNGIRPALPNISQASLSSTAGPGSSSASFLQLLDQGINVMRGGGGGSVTHTSSPAQSAQPSPKESTFPEKPKSISPPSVANVEVTLAHLQDTILLLRNELSFERYLKQQHLSHIGQLRRRQVREARAEADAQNLINNAKILRNKIEKLEAEKTVIKRDFDRLREKARRSEGELAGKLRGLKEGRRGLEEELGRAKRELEEATKGVEELKEVVRRVEGEELESRLKLQSLGIDAREVQKLRADVEKLTAQVRTLEGREFEIEGAKAREELATTQCQLLQMKLAAVQEERDADVRRAREEMEGLRRELDEARAKRGGKMEVQEMIDKAIRVWRGRLGEARRQNEVLLGRVVELQERLLRANQYGSDRDGDSRDRDRGRDDDFDGSRSVMSDGTTRAGAGGRQRWASDAGINVLGSPEPGKGASFDGLGVAPGMARGSSSSPEDARISSTAPPRRPSDIASPTFSSAHPPPPPPLDPRSSYFTASTSSSGRPSHSSTRLGLGLSSPEPESDFTSPAPLNLQTYQPIRPAPGHRMSTLSAIAGLGAGGIVERPRPESQPLGMGGRLDLPHHRSDSAVSGAGTGAGAGGSGSQDGDKGKGKVGGGIGTGTGGDVRVYGRGGVQNVSSAAKKKEKEERKKREEEERKRERDKKGGGIGPLRGIRGFGI